MIPCEFMRTKFNAGHGRHVGAPALPRELELDSAVGMPPDPMISKIHVRI